MADDAGGQNNAGGHHPLVIVSQGGQNSAESRRVVRAQAARASAGASRVTRQKNKEERGGYAAFVPPATSTPTPTSTSTSTSTQNSQRPVSTPTPSSRKAKSVSSMTPFALAAANPVNITSYVPRPLANRPLGNRPLADWLTALLNLDPARVLQGTATFASPEPVIGAVAGSLSAVGSVSLGFASSLFQNVTGGDASNFQLPLGLPRGFAALQNRVQISETMLSILSRTACIDFDSPGLDFRLHKLLFDIILTTAGTALSPIPSIGHPIQGHLRVACTCLTIFQGQRANGAFGSDLKYQDGLNAAWSEVTLLDQNVLVDGKSAEASLWAMFIISVTTGATAQFFSEQLLSLLRDLQLTVWEQVRRILLGFIYPASFLDEPCRSFFQTLRGGMITV